MSEILIWKISPGYFKILFCTFSDHLEVVVWGGEELQAGQLTDTSRNT